MIIVFILLCRTEAFCQNVPKEARRHFDRGLAAIEMAKSPRDFDRAIRELERARSLAPRWADVYYNLGLVQQKASRPGDAATSLKQYLRLAPNAADAPSVERLVNKLEYMEEILREQTVLTSTVCGHWVGDASPKRGFQEWPVQFLMDEGQIHLRAPMMDDNSKRGHAALCNHQTVPVASDGKALSFDVVWEQQLIPGSRSAQEAVQFRLELMDQRTMKGTMTSRPLRGWSYSPFSRKVHFRKVK